VEAASDWRALAQELGASKEQVRVVAEAFRLVT